MRVLNATIGLATRQSITGVTAQFSALWPNGGTYGGGGLFEGEQQLFINQRPTKVHLAERFERARKLLGWPALFVMELRPNYPAGNRTNVHGGGVT